MYKFVCVLSSVLMLSYVLARPQDARAAGGLTTTTTPASIIQQENVNNADGSFNSR